MGAATSPSVNGNASPVLVSDPASRRKPVSTINGPVRLSGRLDQAIRPPATNDHAPRTITTALIAG
jgi:hypothetical protein